MLHSSGRQEYFVFHRVSPIVSFVRICNLNVLNTRFPCVQQAPFVRICNPNALNISICNAKQTDCSLSYRIANPYIPLRLDCKSSRTRLQVSSCARFPNKVFCLISTRRRWQARGCAFALRCHKKQLLSGAHQTHRKSTRTGTATSVLRIQKRSTKFHTICVPAIVLRS